MVRGKRLVLLALAIHTHLSGVRDHNFPDVGRPALLRGSRVNHVMCEVVDTLMNVEHVSHCC